MEHLSIVRHVFVLWALFLPSGCAIGGQTPPSSFYVLAPLEAAGDPAGGVSLGVGPIRVAEYLERPQIVTRRGEFTLELAEFHRWGEPIEESISRVLAENLGALLRTSRVRRHPWRDGREVDVQVELDVRRFDGPAEGPVELVAHWRVRRGHESVEDVFRAREPLESSGYGAIAAAMSRSLQALSRDIAAAIRATPES
jgi:uncharacterized lipoprotein YmbA